MLDRNKKSDPTEPYAILMMKLMLVMASTFSGAITLSAIRYLGNVEWLRWAVAVSWVSGLSIPALAIALFCLAVVSGRKEHAS